jgi:arabinofuranosyltransferase
MTPTPIDPSTNKFLSLTAGAPALFCLLLASASFLLFRQWNFDDGFIVYRVVHNLIHGEGWHYNVAQQLNPCTSALNTIVIALVALLTSTVSDAAHLVNAVSLGIAGWCSFQLLNARWGALSGTVASVGIIASLTFGSMWGLEVHLFTALALAFVLSDELPLVQYGLAAALTLARPDGILFIAWLALRDLYNRTLPWRGGLIAGVVLLPWIWFSYVSFGRPFPDTLTAKMWQGRSGLWGTGHIYAKGLLAHCTAYGGIGWVVLVVAAIGAFGSVWHGQSRYRGSLVALGLFAVMQQAVYVLLNVPPYHWYFAFFDVAVILFAAEGIGLVANIVGPTAIRSSLVGLVSCGSAVVLGGGALLWTLSGEGRRDARDELYRNAALALESEQLPAGALATVEVGTIGFHTRREIVDLTGLTSTNPEFLSGQHNDAYFARPARIVLVHHPVWHHERGLLDDVRFAVLYRQIPGFDPARFGFTAYLLDDERVAAIQSPEQLAQFARRTYSPVIPFEGQVVQKPTETLCIFDKVNGQPARGGANTISPYRFTVSGWAVAAGVTPGKIGLLLESAQGRFISPARRTLRADVAKHLGRPEVTEAGFEAEATLLDLKAGEHYTLSLLQYQGDETISCTLPDTIIIGGH